MALFDKTETVVRKVTVVYQDFSSADWILDNIEPVNGSMSIDSAQIDSITIVERKVTRIIPGWKAKRQEAIQAARNAQREVLTTSDPRD